MIAIAPDAPTRPGDKDLVGPYIDPAIVALKWLDRFCDDHKDGFCEYKTRSDLGLENQAWKDSGDAIVYKDGSQVPKPWQAAITR